MPIPRFVNPHSLLQSVEPISRADISSGGYTSSEIDKDDSILIDGLNELVKRSLPWTSIEPKTDIRELNVDRVPDSTNVVLFRLVSNKLPPISLSLDPKPPPPVISQEPEYEDNEEQATVRRRHAEAAAVDYSWLMQESKKKLNVSRRDWKNVINVTPIAPHFNIALPMILLSRQKKARKTRPPVPRKDLCHFPYMSDAPLRQSDDAESNSGSKFKAKAKEEQQDG
ncbi:hypothetical protein AX17_006578 [Amanita inopinata Kibby_2008]|nr:hypothetical protein AX17_006578 [Amanita inopinata Kibby_2008]